MLALLLSRRGEVVGTDWLVDAVWGEHPPRTARKTLQAYVARLRSLLGEAVIEHAGPGYRLTAEDEDVDAARFEHLAQRGHLMLASHPSDTTSIGHHQQLSNALALWRGPAFGEMGDEPALQAEARRLTELRLTAIEDRIEAEQQLGHRPGMVAELEPLVAEHPTRSRLRGALMLALYRSGRSSDALAVFSQARMAAEDLLGADPDPALVTLNERILRNDPALGSHTPPATDAPSRQDMRNPYKGLRPFDEIDAADFYGRDTLIDTLAHSLADRTLVVVVGASGSGKSSVVRAGLIPRLRREGWAVVTMTPGAHPFESLRQAASPDADAVDWHTDDLDVLRTLQGVGGERPALLVVDQCEELVTQTPTAPRRRFFANLVAVADDPAGRCAVLATLRADFLDQVLADPTIGEQVAAALVPVGALTAAAVMEAASQPALDVGCAVEPELLAELVADMADSPGGLPLLEFALTELFDKHDGHSMTLPQYRSMGGLHAAIGRRAERTYAALEPEQQVVARIVFLRLISVAESGAVTRRRQERDAVESVDPDASGVMDAFGRARLLTLDRDPVTGRATVDIAHESLVSAWPRLASWVQESRDDLRLGRMLSQETDAWEAADRDEGYLIREARLAAYDTWPSTPAVRPTVGERGFLDRSRAERERQRRARSRATRRLRGLVAVTTVVALLATGLAGLAINRADTARAAADAAQARDLASASLAVLPTDPDLAVLLAAEAVRAGGEAAPQAVSALHTAVSRDRLVLQVPEASSIALLPDGRALVGGDEPRVVDIDSAQTVARLPTAGSATVVAAHPDGTFAATASGQDAGIIETWDLTGDLREPLVTRPTADWTTGLDFARDTDLLAAISAVWGGGMAVADAETGTVAARRVVVVSSTETTGRATVALADGGHVAYVADGDLLGSLEVATGAWRAERESSPVHDVVVLGDGTVLTAHDDGHIHRRGGDGETLETVVAGDTAATALGADGTGRVAIGWEDGMASVWSLADDGATRLAHFRASDEPIVDATLAQARLGTVDAASTARVFSIDRVSELGVQPGGGPVEASPDGTMTAVAVDADAGGPAVTLYRASEDEPATVPAPPSATDVLGLAWNGDSSRLTVLYGFERYDPGLSHPTVQIVDATTGDVVQTVNDSLPVRGDVRWGGQLLASAVCAEISVGAVVDTSRITDTLVGLWPIASNSPLVSFAQAQGCGVSADITATGDRFVVATTADFAGATVFDTASGKPMVHMEHEPGERAAVRFSPDGLRLLTAGRDGAARVWDAQTGEQLLALQAEAGPVHDLAWSADALHIVTGHRDGNARVWSAQDGRLIAEMGGHDSAPHVAISPDGSRLLTSADGDLKHWTLDTDELLEIASGRAARALRPTECERYGIDDCP